MEKCQEEFINLYSKLCILYRGQNTNVKVNINATGMEGKLEDKTKIYSKVQ